MKKTEVLVHVITWITLQNITWREAKHKDHLYEIPLIQIVQNRKYMQISAERTICSLLRGRWGLSRQWGTLLVA